MGIGGTVAKSDRKRDRRALTEAQVIAGMHATLATRQLQTRVITALAIPLCILALYPLATVFAGEQTTVSVQLSLSFSLAASFVGVGGLLKARREVQRRKEAEARLDALEKAHARGPALIAEQTRTP